MWPFRSRRRLEAVPEPEPELAEAVEQLRRQVNALRFDIDDLTERMLRREGRESKREQRARPKDGATTVGELRRTGRWPF